MSIPVEAKRFTYTPECLADLPDAPVFTIRFGTRRDRHNYQDEVRLRRLRSHDQTDFRAAFISELRSKWASDEQDIEIIVDAMKRYFSADDELGQAVKEWLADFEAVEAANANLAKGAEPAPLPLAPELDFDPIERERVENMLSDIEDNSEKIGRMHRDNGKREREIRRIALSILLEGAPDGLTLARNRDGALTDDTLYALEDWLDNFSDADEHRGGIAFAQLGTKAVTSFFATKAEEKNSPSPLPTTSGTSGSTKPEPTPLITETSDSTASESDPTPAN